MGSTEMLPRILYVKAGSANPVAPYLTKETAADSINKATKICLPGDTVFVFNGTYGEKVLMNENTSLIGQSRDLQLFSFPEVSQVLHIILLMFGVIV